MKKFIIFLFFLSVLIIVAVLINNPDKSASHQNDQALVTPSPEATQSTSATLPKFNPETHLCDNMGYPLQISSDGFDPNQYSWQVSAPRSSIAKTYKGDVITLGLRNKYGEPEDILYFTIRVEQPDGVAYTANSFVSGANWADIAYPTSFNGGSTNQAGSYTVLYQMHRVIVACDGFVVE